MVQKDRRRISYVLPFADAAAGHRLGVNGLAVDTTRSLLYSGGRDGQLCVWDIGGPWPVTDRKSHLRNHIQAHTHWVNDITLSQSNDLLVSVSSDVTVKAWRPSAADDRSTTIGLHRDYVKCVESPSFHADWVVSGGLDRSIRVWDLDGKGERLRIDCQRPDSPSKGSIYALAATETCIASGGPDSIVTIWDPRTGSRTRDFVGHGDSVRDVLLSRDGDILLSASSDQSVRVWSVRAGRCLATLTMHNDSVWRLWAASQDLHEFYSGDRSGLVAKTSLGKFDGGESTAIIQEQGGITCMAIDDDSVWTASTSSSIHRWQKNDLSIESRNVVPIASDSDEAAVADTSIPQFADQVAVFEPVQRTPVETIEGQNGIKRHLLLNNKRHVLTVDNTGNVLLVDLLTCGAGQDFGFRLLEDVRTELETAECIANWCNIDTRTGQLAVVLEENYCFDADVYLDTLGLPSSTDDQRINLGQWLLRSLFRSLITLEISRDEAYRRAFKMAPPEGNLALMTDPVKAAKWPHQLSRICTDSGDSRAANSPASEIHLSSQASASSQSSLDAAKRTSATPSVSTGPELSTPASPVSPERESKSSFLTKRLRIGFPKRSTPVPIEARRVDEEKAPDTEEVAETGTEEVNLKSIISRIRQEYSGDSGQDITSAILPFDAGAVFLVEQPKDTVIMVQEERIDSGGIRDIFHGRVGTLAQNAEALEDAIPAWLARLLLFNELPAKEMSKISFVVLPYNDLLPGIASSEGNLRLTANRMLRARKILSYVVDHLEIETNHLEPCDLRPEEYLQLYCQDTLVDPRTTLASLRAFIWKSGGDVVLYYKSNGRRPALDRILSARMAAMSLEERKGKVGPVAPLSVRR